MPDDVHCRSGVVNAGGERTRSNVDQLAETEPDILYVRAFKPGGHSAINVISQLLPDFGW